MKARGIPRRDRVGHPWRAVAALAIVLGMPLAAAAQPKTDIEAHFQSIVDRIKFGCRETHGTDDAAFVTCAEARYGEMRAFFERLFDNRDKKGVESREFRVGIECLPAGQEAIVRADWPAVNGCYKRALGVR